MAKKQLGILNKYQIVGSFVLLLTFIACQFNYWKGSWSSVNPPQEWWALFTMSLSNLGISVASKFGMKIPAIPAIEHVRGVFWLIFLLAIGVSYYIRWPINREIWAAAGILASVIHKDTE